MFWMNCQRSKSAWRIDCAENGTTPFLRIRKSWSTPSPCMRNGPVGRNPRPRFGGGGICRSKPVVISNVSRFSWAFRFLLSPLDQNVHKPSRLTAHLSNLPEHVAIIMDGNGRWAQERNLPRVEGHRKGVEVIREVIRAATELGVKYLTLYAFSKENWSRPKLEVSFLMTLLSHYLDSEVKELHENQIRFNVIGCIDDLPGDVAGK